MTTRKLLERRTTNRIGKVHQRHGSKKLDINASLRLELLRAELYRIGRMARNLEGMCSSMLSMIEDSDEDEGMAGMSSGDEDGEDVEE
jgi:hypothetical protein